MISQHLLFIDYCKKCFVSYILFIDNRTNITHPTHTNLNKYDPHIINNIYVSAAFPMAIDQNTCAQDTFKGGGNTSIFQFDVFFIITKN